MDAIQLHLSLNHYPVIALIISIVMLFVGIVGGNKTLVKSALLITVTVGLVGIAVYLSGEEAEHIVEGQAGYSEHFLEEHEELGELAYMAGLILAVFSLALFLIEQFTDRSITLANWLMLVCSLFVLGLFIITALHGGKIKHDEIRGGVTSIQFEVPATS